MAITDIAHHARLTEPDVDALGAGFEVMRMTSDRSWGPRFLLQPLPNPLLAIGFEWGTGVGASTPLPRPSRRRTSSSRSMARQQRVLRATHVLARPCGNRRRLTTERVLEL